METKIKNKKNIKLFEEVYNKENIILLIWADWCYYSKKYLPRWTNFKKSLSKEDLNKDDENHGILKTGDLAVKDSDGYLYITGRKFRDVKLFGHRISLDEVEQILFKKGYNCLCCGFDNKVTIFHTDNNYNNEVLKYISRTTNIHLDCFKLKLIKEFPLNENGKTSYEKLEKFL